MIKFGGNSKAARAVSRRSLARQSPVLSNLKIIAEMIAGILCCYGFALWPLLPS